MRGRTSKSVGIAAILFIVVAIVSGCTSSYYKEAEPIPFDPGLLDGLRGSRGVALVNAQTSTAPVEIGDVGRTVYGNFNQWTEAALDSIRKEFVKAGIGTGAASGKTLRVAVVKANLEKAGSIPGFQYSFRCQVSIEVTLNAGSMMRFDGERGNWLFPPVCDKAITEAASNMLKDVTIRNYIAD